MEGRLRWLFKVEGGVEKQAPDDDVRQAKYAQHALGEAFSFAVFLVLAHVTPRTIKNDLAPQVKG